MKETGTEQLPRDTLPCVYRNARALNQNKVVLPLSLFMRGCAVVASCFEAGVRCAMCDVVRCCWNCRQHRRELSFALLATPTTTARIRAMRDEPRDHAESVEIEEWGIAVAVHQTWKKARARAYAVVLRTGLA